MPLELIKLAVPALGAFAGVLLTGLIALRTHRKSLFVNTVTAERAAWRGDLRTLTAELVTLAHTALADPAESLADLHERRVGIRLRVNPRGGAEHPLDQAIMDCLAALPILLRPASGPADAAAVLAQLEILEAAVQSLLKQEWDKSKREARTGRLQPA